MRTIKTRAWDKVLKEMHYWTLEEIWQSELMPDFKEYEIMLWTGLLDKAGKEIYEGDILKADWHDGRYPVHTIGPVKWDEENARWDLGEGGSPKVDAQYHFEIIGNICEHPELIKEAH